MSVDISTYTNQILQAVYGEQVRSSIANALIAMSNVAGIEILGSYDSLSALKTAHPTGSDGQYYVAGLDLYLWYNSAWTDVCQITGKGISSIAKTSTSGLTDTYTVTYNDGTTFTYTLMNGNGIASWSKTSSSGLTDTYTITFTNGTNTTYTVNNGKSITSITKGTTTGLTDNYVISFNDGTMTTYSITNGYSPSVKLTTNSDKSVTVTVTDASGTTTATIPYGAYTLPSATISSLGGVKIGPNINVTDDGTISVSVASSSTAGVVKTGAGINVTDDGTASAATSVVTSFTIATGTWSSSTTTVNGSAYYTYAITLNHAYVDNPDIMIGAAGTLPTTAEQSAYNCLDYGYVSGTTLTLYASTKPSSNFVIMVRGVD